MPTLSSCFAKWKLHFITCSTAKGCQKAWTHIKHNNKKGASLGVNCDKTETDNAKVGGKGTQVPKSTGLAGCRAVPKPALSSKSSSSASFGAIKEATKSSSSCDSSSSSLSNNIRESLPSYYGELAIQEN